MHCINGAAGVLCVPWKWWREAPEAGGCRRYGLSSSHSCLVPGVRPVDAQAVGIVRADAVRKLGCAWQSTADS